MGKVNTPIFLVECDHDWSSDLIFTDHYDSVEEMELDLEPWYVDIGHYIFDFDGQAIEITPHRYEYQVVAAGTGKYYPEKVKTLLRNQLIYYEEELEVVIPDHDENDIQSLWQAIQNTEIPPTKTCLQSLPLIGKFF